MLLLSKRQITELAPNVVKSINTSNQLQELINQGRSLSSQTGSAVDCLIALYLLLYIYLYCHYLCDLVLLK